MKFLRQVFDPETSRTIPFRVLCGLVDSTNAGKDVGGQFPLECALILSTLLQQQQVLLPEVLLFG